eukprot:1158835-Pelagomonas_calceolata.AAC.2
MPPAAARPAPLLQHNLPAWPPAPPAAHRTCVPAHPAQPQAARHRAPADCAHACSNRWVGESSTNRGAALGAKSLACEANVATDGLGAAARHDPQAFYYFAQTQAQAITAA